MATQITPFTKTPSRQNPSTFSQDMDTRLSEENSRITQMNTQATENNTLASQVSTMNSNVSNKHSDVVAKHTEVLTAKNEAVSAKNTILNYVVPTDAVDSQEVRDSKDKLITNSQFTASGHTKLPKAYIETDTPYTMIDPSTDAINVGGRLVEVVGEEPIVYSELDFTTYLSGVTDFVGEKSFSTTGIGGVYADILDNTKTYLLEYVLTTTATTVSFLISNVATHVQTGSGKGIFSFKPSSTGYIYFKNGSAGDTAFQSLSVKEIQPIVLPNAPFDTDTSHTTTTYSATQAVSKGDFVVSGQQKALNEDFSTPSTSWVDDAGWDYSTGEAVHTGAADYLYQLIVFDDRDYTVTVEISANGGTVTSHYYDGSFKNIASTTGTGTLVGTFDGSLSSNGYIYILATSTATITKVTVTPYNDIVQATRDSVDMYDYELTSANQISVDNGEVVYYSGNNAAGGITGNYYKLLAGGPNLLFYASQMDLTSSSWQDLGTATTMSLANPYFQKVSTDENGNTSQLAVTRDDVWMHLVTKDTYTYSKHSFKGIYQFSENVIADEVMQTYCGSPISPNLYEITVNGTDYYAVFGGLHTRLNAGAFHPSYNIMGTKAVARTVDGTTDNGYDGQWHIDSTLLLDITSVYQAFKNSATSALTSGRGTGTVTITNGNISYNGTSTSHTRPDSAFYDKAYNNQVTLRTPLAFTPSKSDMLEETATKYANGQIDGVEGLVEMVLITQTDSSVSASGSYPGYNYVSISLQNQGFIFDNGEKRWMYNLTQGYLTETILDGNNLFVSNVNTLAHLDKLIFVPKSRDTFNKSNIKYAGELPHTDLIGNPSNYPSMITDTLASGKSVYLNPLLVDDNGVAITATNLSKAYKVSRKIESSHSGVFTFDSGATYTTAGQYTSDSIANTLTKVWLTTEVGMLNYTAKTKSTIKRNDIEIVQVLPKVFASNSHSIYKGGNAVYSAGMGVSTGNGSNGLESRVLESSATGYTHYTGDFYGTSEVSDMLYQDTSIIFNNVKELGKIGAYLYTRTGDYSGYSLGNIGVITNTGYFTYIGANITQAQHNTIALDSSGDKAVKYFLALGKDSDNNAYGVVASKEIDFDVDSGDTGLFEQLIDGTDIDDNGSIVKTDISYIPLNYKMEN